MKMAEKFWAIVFVRQSKGKNGQVLMLTKLYLLMICALMKKLAESILARHCMITHGILLNLTDITMLLCMPGNAIRML